MRVKWLLAIIAMMLFFYDGIAAAASARFQQLWTAHPFYVGLIAGYGSTDWGMLVMKCDPSDVYCNKNTVGASAPLSVSNDQGVVWGATIGYELKPSWGVEATYMKFPTASVELGSPWNYYLETGHDVTQFSSSTWALYGVAKFMTEISDTGFRGFANAGIDFTGRSDVLSETIRVNPTFGVGINYVFPSNIMVEAAFQYITGYGDANEVPAQDYIPFLYSLSLKLLYRL